MSKRTSNKSERGITTVEFAMTAAFFLMMVVVVVAGGHLFWTHNALVEATRRGARYAALQCSQDIAGCTNSGTSVARVRNVVLYDSSTVPSGTPQPFVPNLQASNVTVTYSPDYSVAAGKVSVKIESYDYNFVVPGLSSVIRMPPYETTVVGENAGYLPCTMPCTP
jgi:Flp pilus assembly protein TadG